MYIIKGKYNDEDIFYIRQYLDSSTNLIIKEFSKNIEEANRFPNIETATRKYKKINNNDLEILPVCPFCQKAYYDPPAISRIDNKTKICPNCGIHEAIFNFIINEQKNYLS